MGELGPLGVVPPPHPDTTDVTNKSRHASKFMWDSPPFAIDSATRPYQRHAAQPRAANSMLTLHPTRPPIVGCSGLLGGVYRNELAGRRRRWHWLPALFEIFDVKLDSFTDEAQGFVTRARRGYAARKIGDICTEGRGALFKHYQVTHSSISYFFRPACFNALLSVPGGTSGSELSSDGDRARLGWVMKLAVAPSNTHKHPAVRLDQRDQLANLHSKSLPSSPENPSVCMFIAIQSVSVRD
jgi:hypothetical protein